MQLFRTALGVLRLMEPRLLGQPFDVVAHDLTHLPQTLDVEEVLQKIDSVDLTEARFDALLAAANLTR